MSGEGLGMVGNELGFLWEDHQNQFMSSWANLSTNNSENYSSGCGGTDQSTGREEDERKKTNLPPATAGSDGGQKGNLVAPPPKKAAKGGSGEGPASNKKRSRGGVSKTNKNGKNNNDNNNNNKNLSDGVVKVGGGESDHEMHIWTERERRKKMRNMFSNLHALLPQLPSKADKSTIVDEAVSYIRTLEETLQKLQKQKLEKLQSGASTSTATATATATFTSCEPSLIMPNIPLQNKLANYHDHTVTREAFLADQGPCNDLASNIVRMNNNNNISNPLNTTLSAVPQVNSPVVFQTWTSSNVVLNLSGEEAHISVCSPKKPGLFSSICYVLEKHKIALVSAQLSSDGVRNMYLIHANVNKNGGPDQFLEGFNSVEEVFKQAVAEIMYWVSS